MVNSNSTTFKNAEKVGQIIGKTIRVFITLSVFGYIAKLKKKS
jgi:hypothetical protein